LKLIFEAFFVLLFNLGADSRRSPNQLSNVGMMVRKIMITCSRIKFPSYETKTHQQKTP